MIKELLDGHIVIRTHGVGNAADGSKSVSRKWIKENLRNYSCEGMRKLINEGEYSFWKSNGVKKYLHSLKRVSVG